MKRVENLQQLKSEFAKVKDGVAGDTIFGAKALMFIAEKLEYLVKGETNGKRISTKKGIESKRRVASNSQREENKSWTNDEVSMEVHQETQTPR